jgi:hypothetical protein
VTISRTSTKSGGEGRSPSPPRANGRWPGLALLISGVALGAAAAWLAVAGDDGRVPAEPPAPFDVTVEAAEVQQPSGTGEEDVDVRGDAIPDTVAGEQRPQTTPTSTTLAPAAGTTELDQQPTDPDGAAAFGPIAVASGALADVVDDESLSPVRLTIESLGVDARVDEVGYDTRKDEMEVPRSAEVAGWYEFGPSPGDPGSAVISAHVDWGGKKGAFFDLRKIEPRALIVIEYEDGSLRTFTAVTKNSYDKQELPVEELFSRSGPPVLTLITCGGAFNPSIRSYADNIVVSAVEVFPDEYPREAA